MAYTRRGFAQNFWVVKTVGCDSVGMGGILFSIKTEFFQAFVCLVRDLASIRVVDNHHHHVQLRCHVDGQQNRQQRQDHPLPPT